MDSSDAQAQTGGAYKSSSRAPNFRRIRELLSLYDGTALPKVQGGAPRIAVVGAGMAGLVSAHLLGAAGCKPMLFDAAPRVGGRVRTDRDILVPGVVSELGGEFVDSTHADILALARRFDCTLIDTAAKSERHLKQAYRFGGHQYVEADIDEAFRTFAPRIAADAARLSPQISRERHTELDRRLDDMSIIDYLRGIGMDGWLLALIDAAYTTLNGIEAGVQSSINLLTQIGIDTRSPTALFGDSDERWKLAEGLDCLVNGLARTVSGSTFGSHRLTRLARRGAGFSLDFDADGRMVNVAADAVVLALPFTLLRRLDCRGVFSTHKQHAIDHLAYGTNSKLLVATRRRVWREQGFEGGLYTDGIVQTGWDSSRLRPGEQGVYTYYFGGQAGLDVGNGTQTTCAARLATAMDATWPGFAEAQTERVQRVHWPSEPWTLASYSTYSVGQHTRLAGDEARTEDNIYFAGEHCSRTYQGYMQGAAETGRRAAMAILKRLSAR